MSLSHSELKQLLHYDPETGIWRWLVHRGRMIPGDRAGSIHSLGYWLVMIGEKNYRSSRLAWFYVTGKWPPEKVDHKNGKRADDRWDNIRLATASQNAVNHKKRVTNSSGYKGVYQNKTYKRFYAQITIQGYQVFLGSRKTAEEAYALYVEAAKKHHGEFARVE